MEKENAVPLLPGSLGLLLRAPFKRADVGADFHTVYRVPRIDDARLRRYAAHLGFAPGALPLTGFYLIAQRAHLASMLGPQYPFRIVGMIHLENAMEQLDAVDLARPLQVDTDIRIAPPGERGQVEVEFATVMSQDGRACIRCRSLYLAVQGKRPAGARPPREAAGLPPVIAGWPLLPDDGRRYAAVSGDWNLIHLWTWSARLMGLRTPIIHGMHTVARACAAFEAADGRRTGRIDVRFKAPIPLGSQADLHAPDGEGRFVVSCGAQVAVEGAISLVDMPECK